VTFPTGSGSCDRGRDRRAFLGTLAGGLLAAPLAAGAQQAGKVYRIGYLDPSSQSSHNTFLPAFRKALRGLGYAEGKNLVLEQRYAKDRPERLSVLAAELVKLPVSILVTFATPATLAAKAATTTIPILIVVGEPVGAGIVPSLSHPGGNITGLALNNADVAPKRLQLLKETVPTLARVAVLANRASPLFTALHLAQMRSAAERLRIALQPVEVQGPSELVDAFRVMTRGHAEAVIILPDPALGFNRKRIATLAVQHRLPSIYDAKVFAEDGGLLGYGPVLEEFYPRAASYVDKILKGAKPGDLPIEQPTKFELVINLRTAKALGLTIPPSLLARADQVIE
jgi:putative ABC transport system substrate-binding protein